MSSSFTFPTQGELFFATPTGTLALRYKAGTSKPEVITGRKDDGTPDTTPIREEHTSGAYVEFGKDGRSEGEVRLRPGLICRSWPDISRCVIVPARGRPQSRPTRPLPFYETQTARSSEAVKYSRFEFWNMWGIDQDDLLDRLTSVDATEISPIQQLIEESLGLRNPTWFSDDQIRNHKELQTARAAARWRQGDIVKLRLPLSSDYPFYVVVSDDALNGASLNSMRTTSFVLLLKLVPYEEGDSAEQGFLPIIGDNNRNIGHRLTKHPLSLGLYLLRGVRIHEGIATRTRFSLRSHPTLFRKALDGLRRFYGGPQSLTAATP